MAEIIDSEVYGYIVKHNSKLWQTPNGKFFWTTSAAAKNSFGCHWYPPFTTPPLKFNEVQKLKALEKKKIEVLRVKLVAEVV